MAAHAVANDRRVTLVEDDPDVVALVTSLGEMDLEVFNDGEVACEALVGGAATPHLVILDLDLPGMHGLEVLKRLRHHPRTRRVPIVIFTATDRSPDEGYRLGANAWVRKSRDAAELEASIRSMLAFWTGLNQPAGLVTA